jgi:beta-N-acetylhexosaminidase
MKAVPNDSIFNAYKDFTSEQKAGQLLMVGFEGQRFDSNLEFLISKLKVGGLILFRQNISGPGQISELCKTAQETARACGQPPLLIAVDQEGGKVARLKKPFTEFAGNPDMQGIEDAARFATISVRELTSVGINMNLAPVLDVARQGTGGIMKERAFGDDPARVTQLGLAIIKGLQSGGIMSVAKHFPGIGRTRMDSHDDLPFLDTPLETLASWDFLPFESAIRAGVAGVMLSHIVFQQLDANWPASLSAVIAKDLLRGRMAYQGVVMTDDLDMGAVVRHYDIRTVIQRVLGAEIDIALICHKGPAIQAAFEEIMRLAHDRTSAAQSAERSLERIMKLKTEYLIK